MGAALARLLPALLLLGPTALAASRNVRFEHLSLEDGLSQSSVTTILQDRTGFMWFGTQDGLNRYDGYSFTVFKHDPRDPRSLTPEAIWSLHQDEGGSLWIGTFGGLSRLRPGASELERFRNDPSDRRSLSSNRVRAIVETEEGLWIGTEGGGLNRLEPGTGAFERIRHDPQDRRSLSSDLVRTLMVDREGFLWVGTLDAGLNRYDPATGEVRRFRHDPADPGSLGGDGVRAVLEDRDGRIWVGTIDHGLDLFDPSTERFVHYRHDPTDPTSLSSDHVTCLFRDSRGTVWVGTEDGLDAFRPGSDDFERYRSDPLDPGSLSDDYVTAIYEDRSGLLWVGTGNDGLNKWNRITEAFRVYRSDMEGGEGLADDSVYAVQEEDDTTVWVGTFAGLDRLETDTGEVTRFRSDAADPTTLSDDRIVSLLVDSRDTLWVGTYGNGLNRFERQSETFVRYLADPDDPGSPSGRGIAALLEDRDGALWLGLYRGGVNRFDRASQTFTRYDFSESELEGRGGYAVSCLFLDSSGTLWIGTYRHALHRLDRTSGTIVPWVGRMDRSSLGIEKVWTLYEDDEERLWIGTRGAGLYRWDAEERRAGDGPSRWYSEEHGLPNSVIYGILPDEEGFLWLSTNRGLSRFDPDSETFRNFDSSHGLPGNELNYGAHHRGASGLLYFGGVKGLTVFDPARIRINDHVPPIVLTSVRKNNREVVLGAEPAELEVGWRDHLVSFDLAALDFTAPEKNRYAYLLEGYDRDWIELGTHRRVTFTSLPAGRYVLRMKGSNNDGVWNEQGISIGMKVAPPPWKSWWAYAAYLVLAAGSLAGYVRAQTRKLRREEEYSRRLEEEVRARTEELQRASITDPLTGLRNRQYLMTELGDELERSRERFHPVDGGGAGEGYLFLAVDLDGFKTLNDACGHAVGDRALVEVAELLRAACRGTDTVIRWGGDEFVVVARRASRDSAETMAERIRDSVESLVFSSPDGERIPLRASVGFAFYPFVAGDPAALGHEEVLRIADRALYLAKNSGRNAWVGIYSTDKTPDGVVELIEADLDRAVQNGEVELRTSIRNREALVWERTF